MQMSKLAEKNGSFVEWSIKSIAKEKTAMKRMNYSYQLAELIEGSKDEILRAVEEKTLAKDKNKVLEIIDRHLGSAGIPADASSASPQR